MTLLAGELATMRATAAAALPDTCTIQRDTPTADGMGGQTSSWANAATNVPCRYSPDQVADGERELGGKITAVNGWRFTFAYDADVRPADRIVADSRTFEVLSVDGDRSWQLALVVRCIEMT